MGMSRGRSRALRVLICDDSAELRAMLRAQLADHPRLEVVGEAANGEEAIERAIALEPDAVLMDVGMPVLDGIEATRRIRAVLPETRVVAFAGSDDSEVVMAMIEAGASAYCAKRAGVWELERAITGVADPVLRVASAIARAVAGRARAELAALELKRLTGAREVTLYLPQKHVGDAPPLATQAFVNAALTRSGDSLAVPLIADGETMGALVVHGIDPDADLDVVAAVADLTASSMAADRRIAESAAEARRDALTGLANRRAFEEQLDAALAAERAARATSLLLLDLDDFKHINDTRGHEAGDRVLRQVALALLREGRAGEEVFRIGGEEFAVVVDGDAKAAFHVATRMRTALARQRRGEPLPTMSAGIASAPEHARTRERLLAAADAALYAAKWSGKDRVLVYGRDARDAAAVTSRSRLRILVVDDDPRLRTLLRATFEAADIEIDEAHDAAAATAAVDRFGSDVVLLDIAMPDLDGISLCHRLKSNPATAGIRVVLLTGSDVPQLEQRAAASGADALVRKPFSPLELLSVVEDVAAGEGTRPLQRRAAPRAEEQLLLYADDLRRLLELERGQRALLQRAYRDTVTALASALESKDSGTGAHSERVQRYAATLTRTVDPSLLEDLSLEYGFLLHDIGKIGIPDRVLLKPRSLSKSELRLMQTHTVLGEQMLGGVALLQGAGLRVVRSHHERWDGNGYPDGLAGAAIPISARIFAVADTLDAVMSERPYRAARSWDAAREEIERGSGSQFDPDVVAALSACEPELLDIARAFATTEL
jgi:putative two-component system response regulator